MKPLRTAYELGQSDGLAYRGYGSNADLKNHALAGAEPRFPDGATGRQRFVYKRAYVLSALGELPALGGPDAERLSILVSEIRKEALSLQESAKDLRREIARGIAIRQSVESKESRAQVLDACASKLWRILEQYR